MSVLEVLLRLNLQLPAHELLTSVIRACCFLSCLLISLLSPLICATASSCKFRLSEHSV